MMYTVTTSDRVLGAEACPQAPASIVSSASAGAGPSPVSSSQIQTGKSHPAQGLCNRTEKPNLIQLILPLTR